MQLQAYSRFYRRQHGRLAAVEARLPPGLPPRAALEGVLQGLAADLGMAAALRQLRNAVMLRLIESDVLHDAALEDVCRCISELAEVCLQGALEQAQAELQARFGLPRRLDGELAQFWVVGMGKLGGTELNTSSDIDLVFVHDGDGLSDGAEAIDCADYFSRLVRKLVPLLADTTGDGFVFRVDTRLRPNGDSGPSVVSLEQLEEYFLAQGRAWERFAWLKSRIVALWPPHAGLAQAQARLDAVVEPFVWRRYLDFTLLESLRQLHRQIRAEAQRRASGRPERANDVKLGRGGIREIEFIVQLLQIVRGARLPQVRDRNTLRALQLLAEAGLLDPGVAASLARAYRFLRRLEHRIQYLDDAQTHSLPTDDTDLEQLALALGPGLAAAQPQAPKPACALLRELDAVRETVAGEFDTLLRLTPRCQGCQRAPDSLDSLRDACRRSGLLLDDSMARLQALERSPRYLALSEDGRARFLAVLGSALTMLGERPRADAGLSRLIDLLETIGRRENYLAYFAEQAQALRRLLDLLEASSWAAAYARRNPWVLDELLQLPQRDFDPAACAADCRAQRQRLVHAKTWDSGEGMDLLRRADQAELFRILLRDLGGLLTLEQVADQLSALADCMLQLALDWCALELAPPRGFAVIAYGKLGGKELGYGGDLDIVFLYDDASPDAAERGAAFARKLVWWLTAATPAGRLFEIDTRLRPNGNAGLLVTSLEAFERYQLGRGDNVAATWEHQALSRARGCAGDPATVARFDAVRRQVLAAPRAAAQLLPAVLTMRARVADGHPNPGPLFDLKHDPGGMVDVEFSVQTLILLHACQYAELLDNVGNIALLERCERLRLLPPGVGSAAAAAYRTLRRLQHQLRLDRDDGGNRADPATLGAERDAVRALWSAVFGQVR